MAREGHDISYAQREGARLALLVALLGGKGRQFGLLVGSDILGLWLAFGTSYGLLTRVATMSPPTEPYLLMVGALTLVVLGHLYVHKGYEALEDRRPESEIGIVVKGASWGILLGLPLILTRSEETPFSRNLLLTWWLTAIPTLIVLRLMLRALYAALWRKGHLQQRILLFGVDDETENIYEQLVIQGHKGWEFVGVLLDPQSRRLPSHRSVLPELGAVVDLASVAKAYEINRVFVAMSAFSHDQLLHVFGQCQDLGLAVSLISEIANATHYELEINDYVGLLTMRWEVSSFRLNAQHVLKRCLDILVSLCAMPVLCLLYLGLGFMITREDKGPVIYRRRVIGKDGVPFDAFKFRSMRINADHLLLQDAALRREFEENYKLPNDPRLTKIGGFIRKYSLDEFPQFLNVLKGQMSLVGPRMVSEPELEKFGPWQKKLLTVKPGMTGFWQVRGRHQVSYADRVKMDMIYIDYGSIWMDVYLLIATVWQVCKAQGAH